MAELFEKTLSSEKIYDGKVFRVTKDIVKLSNGEQTLREVVHHNGGVVIAAEKDGKILFVKQYRYPAQSAIYELPAGKLDKGNEDILSAAKREFEEETGYTANKWEAMGFVWSSPGFCSEKLYLFKASELSYKSQNLDEDEILDCIAIEKDKVFDMIKSGEINDSKSISAIMKAYKL